MDTVNETITAEKAFKRLIETWKKNEEIKQKAMLVLQKNLLPKKKKKKKFNFLP